MSFFFFFLSLRGGTCLLHVPVLRPASRAGLMHDLRGGTSVVYFECATPSGLPDGVCLLFSAEAAQPLSFEGERERDREV